MSMDRIEDFKAFVAIIDRGSLTGAARHLSRSLQSVSRSLTAVERGLGVELVRRTTRRSSPTEAGLAFYRRLNAALAEIEAAKAEASNRRAEPSGTLRVAGSSVFGPLYLVPAIAAFLDIHPRIEVELDLSDRAVDLVNDGFDLAIRMGRSLPDSSLKARRLTGLRYVIVASPAYLARHGRPRRPDDLARHQCIIHTRMRDAWAFRTDQGVRTVKVSGRLRTDGMLAASEAAVHGVGITNAPLWQVRKLVDQGRLEILLTRFEPPPLSLHAVWPATNLLDAKTRLFVDFLATRLKAERL
jgi:DNA-binding transcriptional LysR family regulator